MEADETRRRALDNFTGFTGAHRGAQTLVAVVPGEGLAADASGIAYAERFSRTRRIAPVHPQQATSRVAGSSEGVGGTLRATTGAAATTTASGHAMRQPISDHEEQPISGLLLGHRVSARDMINSP